MMRLVLDFIRKWGLGNYRWTIYQEWPLGYGIPTYSYLCMTMPVIIVGQNYYGAVEVCHRSSRR